MDEEELEQLEFPGGQFFSTLPTFELEGLRVNRRCADLKTGLRIRALGMARSAAEQGMNPSQQFAHTERLGNVIIRAEIQSYYFIKLLALGSKHQNWRGDLLGAKLFADVVAAQT